jgi:hypothetical protein
MIYIHMHPMQFPLSHASKDLWKPFATGTQFLNWDTRLRDTLIPQFITLLLISAKTSRVGSMIYATSSLRCQGTSIHYSRKVPLVPHTHKEKYHINIERPRWAHINDNPVAMNIVPEQMYWYTIYNASVKLKQLAYCTIVGTHRPSRMQRQVG